MRTLSTMLLIFSLAVSGFAQLDPVSWSFTAEKVEDGEFDLMFTADINPGWYVYAQHLESDEGPVPTSINFQKDEGYELIGETEEKGNKKEGFDELFQMNITKYSKRVQYVQRIKIKDSQEVIGFVEFMTCDDKRCLPPKMVDFTFNFQN